jgi:hypothetical protein
MTSRSDVDGGDDALLKGHDEDCDGDDDCGGKDSGDDGDDVDHGDHVDRKDSARR